MRTFRNFSWKDSNLRICCSRAQAVESEIVRQRTTLEAYIERHPEFRTSYVPVGLRSDAPRIARLMQEAAARVGVGPMAAVAGTIAQLAAEAGVAAGATEAIVENGGDIYLISDCDITVALHTGTERLGSRLALALSPAHLPLSLCSSSSRMGHSDSRGDCDLATVASRSAALADAAATHACNLVRDQADIDCVLEQVGAIRGVAGLLIVKGDRVGLYGDLPPLVKHADPDVGLKVTKDRRSSE